MSNSAGRSHRPKGLDYPLDIRDSREGALLKVRVQPRSSKSGIVGVHASALKVKVTPPPEGGRANDACLKVLAKALSIPGSSLSILRGGRERDKTILIQGFSPDEVRRRLGPLLEGVRD